MDALSIEEHDLDILDDETHLVTLENVVVDLENILLEMGAAKGVNKTIAVAIEAINPDILPELYPSASYTVETSATNFKVTLESVTLGVAAAIAALVAGIALLLIKIIKWIRESLVKSIKHAEDNVKLIKNSQILAKEIYDIERKSQLSDRAPYDDVEKQINDEYNLDFAGMHSDLLKELVLGSKVRSALLSVGGNIDKYIEQINNKVIIYEQAIRIAKSDKSGENVKDVVSKLSDQQKAISLMNAAALVDGVIGTSTPGVVGESLPVLRDNINARAEERTTNPFTYNSIFESLRGNKFVVDDLYVSNVERTDKNLSMIEKRLESLEQLSDKIQTTHEVLDALREAGGYIKHEVNGLQSYISVVNKVVSINGQFATKINEAVNRHYKLILKVAANSLSQHTQDMARRSRTSIGERLN